GAETRQHYGFGLLVSQSHAARRLMEQICSLANEEGTVLIIGESGTKKERVAEEIHRLCSRSQRPLIKFSCTASASNMLDAELFGSNAGTSAGALKVGRLELASGGTLFLDELDALPIDLQVKLLRVLEGKVIERASSTERVNIDTRVICATTKDLRQLVDDGKFRKDLYYRLYVVSISIPPIRERPVDIPVIAEQILKDYAENFPNKSVPKRISPHVLDVLMSYRWPGNIRELEHVIERAIMHADSDEIQPKDIIVPIQDHPADINVSDLEYEETAGLGETIAGVERALIRAALHRAAGNQAKAAHYLQIPRTTLRDKMAKYGLFSGPIKDEFTDLT
ncbi:MAG: sigma 54-interacting transcriptional regulator, partial [Planctomycetota bacterium]